MTSKSRTTYNESAGREYQSPEGWSFSFLFCKSVMHMLAYWEPSGAKEGVVFLSVFFFFGYTARLLWEKMGQARRELCITPLSFATHRWVSFPFSFPVLTTRALHWHYDPARSKNSVPLACTDTMRGGGEGRRKKVCLLNIYTFLPLAFPRERGVVDGYYIYRCTFWNFMLLSNFRSGG